MSIVKVSLLTIVASFVVFGKIQMSTAVPVTFEKYLGLRYILAVAIRDSTIFHLSCGSVNIRKREDENYTINVISKFWTYGRFIYSSSHGKFTNSELHFDNATRDNGPKSVFTLEGFNDTPEVMMFPRDCDLPYQYSQLMSTKPVVSTKAKLAFEERAKNLGAQVHFVVNDNCS